MVSNNFLPNNFVLHITSFVSFFLLFTILWNSNLFIKNLIKLFSLSLIKSLNEKLFRSHNVTVQKMIDKTR